MCSSDLQATSNIAIVAGVVLGLLWIARIRGGWAAGAAIAILIVYAYVAGGGPSVVRATAMAARTFARLPRPSSGVSMTPGDTALTRIPFGASSRATLRVKADTKALVPA